MKQSKSYLIFFSIAMFGLGLLTLYLFLQNPEGSQRGLLFVYADDYFMDFFNTLNYTAIRDPYHDGYGGLVNRNYLPLAYVILYPFSKLGDYVNMLPKDLRLEQASIIGCFIFLLISFGAFFYLLYEGKTGRRAGKLLMVFACSCSGMVIYNIDRANTVILSAAALMMFLLFYQEKRVVYRHLALMGLAIAAALKVYPVIFGLLLIYERRWKDIPFAVVYGLGFVFLPFLFFEGGFQNIPLLIYNVQLNSAKYYGGSFSLVTNHILDTSAYMAQGFLVTNLMLAMVFFLAWAQETPWKRILLLMCGLLLTPTHSGYYCGLYMFIPLLFFLNEEKHAKSDILFLILFILLLSPFQFVISLPETKLFRPYLDNYMVQNMAAIVMYIWLIADSVVKLVKWFTKPRSLKAA